MLEADRYSAQLVQVTTSSGQKLWAQFGVSSKKRTPQVVLTFKVVGGPCAGAVVQWTGFFTDTAGGRDGKTPAERAMDALATVGFVGDDPDAFNDQTPHGNVEIITEVEDDGRGGRHAKVKFINSGAFTLAEENRMSRDDLKSLGARLKAAKAKRNAPSDWDPNGPGSSQPTGLDDDIPF